MTYIHMSPRQSSRANTRHAPETFRSFTMVVSKVQDWQTHHHTASLTHRPSSQDPESSSPEETTSTASLSNKTPKRPSRHYDSLNSSHKQLFSRQKRNALIACKKPAPMNPRTPKRTCGYGMYNTAACMNLADQPSRLSPPEEPIVSLLRHVPRSARRVEAVRSLLEEPIVSFEKVRLA
jgi:hypothetical protein